MIKRDHLVNQLAKWRDQQVIKVITGVRRSGKSTLLDLYTQFLLEHGVFYEQIIRLNLEDVHAEQFSDYRQLHEYVLSRLKKTQRYYLLIDEVQLIDQWEKAINSLFLRHNLDIYVTGSNAYVLSGELATLLSGRYVTINVLPLSWREYVGAHAGTTDMMQLYRAFATTGGLPYITNLSDREQMATYINDLYNTIILKDVVTRRKIQDVKMLERVVTFLLDNIGAQTSPYQIATALATAGFKVSVNTIDKYLSALVDAFIFYKADRYDAKGKQLLKTGDKYYVVDQGFRYFLLRQNFRDWGKVLENIVYLELKRRGFQVYVGQAGAHEIDFIAVRSGVPEYFQVCQSAIDRAETYERELRPLRALRDNYPKTLLTLDFLPDFDEEGIKHLFALDWLAQ